MRWHRWNALGANYSEELSGQTISFVTPIRKPNLAVPAMLHADFF